jgi:hypothetical protein
VGHAWGKDDVGVGFAEDTSQDETNVPGLMIESPKLVQPNSTISCC